MRSSDIIIRAGRNLRQAKMRTFLTAMAISVGAITLTLSLAAGQGSRDYATKLIQSNVDPQALFIVKNKSVISNSGTTSALQQKDDDTTHTYSGANMPALTDADITKLRAMSDLTDVKPVYRLSVDSLAFSNKPGKQYTGEVSTYDPSVISDTAAGTLPTRGTNIADIEATVPDSFATALGVSAQKLLGQTVTLTIVQPAPSVSQAQIEQAFMTGGTSAVTKLTQGSQKTITLKIVAVLKQSSTSFSGSNSLQVSNATAQEIYNFTTAGTSSAGKYMAATAKAKNGVTPESAKEQIGKQGYAAETAKDLQSLLFTIVNILQGIVGGFGVLALIASVFGIVNTQYISVLERTRQIGLMKALGARRRDIGRLFRYEAAWVGFLGGLVGSGIAVVLGTMLNPVITDKLSLGKGTNLLEFVWWQIAILVLVLVVIAIVAGWLPSRKAAKLDPIEALRTE